MTGSVRKRTTSKGTKYQAVLETGTDLKTGKRERTFRTFDSKKEARRYEALLARLHAGEIRKLRLQQDFTLQEAYTTTEGKRVRAIRYRADFCYDERDYEAERTAAELGFPCESWVPVVEDVKSRATRTKEYIIKRKLMLEKYNIEIREV